MPATFQELLPCRGVDEHTTGRGGGAGIVVPLGGSNAVLLADGPGLKVEGKSGVTAPEINDFRTGPVWSKLRHLCVPAAQPTERVRLFDITAGHSLPGLDVAKVEARKNGTRNPEVTLKVLVLSSITKTISIRSTQVLDENNNTVSFTDTQINADSAQRLLDEMTAIWKPQANIAFKLGRTDPVLLRGLKPDSKADINNKTVLDALVENKDAAAHFTMFLVRKAFDTHQVSSATRDREVDGVTRAKWLVALISDARLSNRTFAHEAGHFLGSLNEPGQYSGDYGEQGDDWLMTDGGSRLSIPYGEVTSFNKGYRG
jgi:hypothetical protein